MNLVEASRKTWSAGGDSASLEQINCGSLQRIAAAVEIVANNYTAIINERDYWRRRAVEHEESCRKLRRSYRALKANHTRLKVKTQKTK